MKEGWDETKRPKNKECREERLKVRRREKEQRSATKKESRGKHM